MLYGNNKTGQTMNVYNGYLRKMVERMPNVYEPVQEKPEPAPDAEEEQEPELDTEEEQEPEPDTEPELSPAKRGRKPKNPE